MILRSKLCRSFNRSWGKILWVLKALSCFINLISAAFWWKALPIPAFHHQNCNDEVMDQVQSLVMEDCHITVCEIIGDVGLSVESSPQNFWAANSWQLHHSNSRAQSSNLIQQFLAKLSIMQSSNSSWLLSNFSCLKLENVAQGYAFPNSFSSQNYLFFC